MNATDSMAQATLVATSIADNGNNAFATCLPGNGEAKSAGTACPHELSTVFDDSAVSVSTPGATTLVMGIPTATDMQVPTTAVTTSGYGVMEALGMSAQDTVIMTQALATSAANTTLPVGVSVANADNHRGNAAAADISSVGGGNGRLQPLVLTGISNNSSAASSANNMVSDDSSSSPITTTGEAAASATANGPRPSYKQWTHEEQFKQLYEISEEPERKTFLDSLFDFMQKRGSPVSRIPIMAKVTLDLYKLFTEVCVRGGLVEVINKKMWRDVANSLGIPTSITSAAFTLKTQYTKYLYPYECETKGFSHPDDLRALETNRRDMRSQSASTPQTPNTPVRFYNPMESSLGSASNSLAGALSYGMEPAAKRSLSTSSSNAGMVGCMNMRTQQVHADSSGTVTEIPNDTASGPAGLSPEANALIMSMEINGLLFQGILYSRPPMPVVSAPATPLVSTSRTFTAAADSAAAVAAVVSGLAEGNEDACLATAQAAAPVSVTQENGSSLHLAHVGNGAVSASTAGAAAAVVVDPIQAHTAMVDPIQAHNAVAHAGDLATLVANQHLVAAAVVAAAAAAEGNAGNGADVPSAEVPMESNGANE